MSDDILDVALQRREELEQELEKLNAFIAMYRALKNTTREHSGNIESAESAEPSTDSAPDAPRRTMGNPPPSVILAAVRDILQETGEPMTRSQLLDELNNRGLEIRGRDPRKVLGTTLWRARDLFANVSDGYIVNPLS